MMATFSVTNTNNSGAGSFRQAIIDANANAGHDTINFNISGVVPHVINVTIALPSITDPVLIDGWSEPDFTNTPVIRIDGELAGDVNGLIFTGTSDSSTVRGLMITRFNQNGIQIDLGADGVTVTGNWIGSTGTGSESVGNSNNGINVQGANTIIGGTGAGDPNVITNNGNEGINLTGAGAIGTLIQGNIIGLDPDGATGSGNQDVGIALLAGSDNTTIGGDTEAARNIISMNFEGIEINSSNNVVQGNFIGTDLSGTFARGNRSDDGIEINSNATGNLIGGEGSAEGNVVSGNWQDGIQLNGPSNSVIGNIIGLDASGTMDLGNGRYGIRIAAAADNIIGGTTAGSRNVISGNNTLGILLAGSTGTTIQGNYVGTDITGSIDLGNTSAGLMFDSNASGNTIGGSVSGAGNVISGNNSHGVYLVAGCNDNTLEGNIIGLTASGTEVLGNSSIGIQVASANNTIGGTTTTARNVVSANAGGISLSGAGATGNIIQGNYIGTNAGGQDLGNDSAGILLASETANNLLGGIQEGAGNIIAFNGSDGIRMNTDAGADNAILRNSVYSNSGIGIDLLNDNVTANDAGDSDTGPNELQNYPFLSSAISADGNTTIIGLLNSTAGTTFRIEFFSTPTGDATGFGEGQTYLDFITVTTDGSGDVTFDTTLVGVSTLKGHVVSATATVDLGVGQYGSTSEFAANVTVSHLPADHDDPCNSALIPVDQSCSFQVFSNTDATDSGIPLTQCDGYAGGDIWLKIFVPPAGNVLLQVESDSIPGIPDTLDMIDQPGLAVYSGSCTAPVYDTCWIDPGSEPPFMDPQILLTGYTPGDTLYLRVWEHSNDDPGNFGICASVHEVKVLNVSGSGAYCSGGTGLSVHLDSSEAGVDYQLLKNGIEEGPPIPGTGTALSWPDNKEGVYEVTATSILSGLSQKMNGRAIVIEDPLPVVTFGYGYDKLITVDSGKVSGLDELVNFPMLVSIPGDNDLRTTDFGGHVENSNGYDIVFTDDNYNPIPFDRISYNPETGAYSAWVNVPSMYFDADTRIHMLYGNPGISSDHSSRATWPSAYVQVMHLDGDFTDASFTGNYGVNDGTTDTAGKLGNGRRFDGTDDKIIVYEDPSLDGTIDEATLSLWINFSDAADGDHQFIMSTENRFSGGGYEWASQGSGNHFFYPNGYTHDNYNLGPNPFTDSVWHYLAVTMGYSTREVDIYVDGVPMVFTTENVPTWWTFLAELDNWLWGGNPDRSSRYFLGSMDEIRVQTMARTGDWLMTEFLNQNDPAGFYTLSPEIPVDQLADVCLDAAPFVLDEPNPPGGSFSGTGVSNGIFDPGIAGAGDFSIVYQYTDGNGCVSSGSKIQRVLDPPAPAIAGNNYLCPNTSGETYSTPAVAGHSYLWVITGEGASITGGQGTNQVTVDWGNASGTLTLSETNDSTGCDSTTAEFNVSIWEVTDLVMSCPGDTTGYVNDQCEFILPDYTSLAVIENNCGPAPVITQSPIAGTVISGSGTIQEITLLAEFDGGHESGCGFNVMLQDTVLPGVLSLRDTTILVGAGITETYVAMPLPGFADNCGLQSVTNDFNGGPDASGNYPLGTTRVVYTLTDVGDNSALFGQQVTIQAEDEPGPDLFIPEGFSPNEDGLNDRFEILGLDLYPDNELRVFNVHGNEVYRMAGYDNTWDGTSASNLNKGSKLPTGTYYYVLDLGTGNDVLKGFVYLRRE